MSSTESLRRDHNLMKKVLRASIGKNRGDYEKLVTEVKSRPAPPQ